MVNELITQIVNNANYAINDLVPKTLYNLGLARSIEQYCRLLHSGTIIEIELENGISSEIELQIFKPDLVNIYRTCLEVLNNLRKHDTYSFLNITFEYLENTLIIEFHHNGMGINNEDIEKLSKTSNGLGLKSIDSRLSIINAKIDYYKEPGHSAITLFLPLPNAQ